MNTFQEWLEVNHPEYFVEAGFLNSLVNNPVTRAATLAVAPLFAGTADAAPPKANPPAKVAKVEVPLPADTTVDFVNAPNKDEVEVILHVRRGPASGREMWIKIQQSQRELQRQVLKQVPKSFFDDGGVVRLARIETPDLKPITAQTVAGLMPEANEGVISMPMKFVIFWGQYNPKTGAIDPISPDNVLKADKVAPTDDGEDVGKFVPRR